MKDNLYQQLICLDSLKPALLEILKHLDYFEPLYDCGMSRDCDLIKGRIIEKRILSNYESNEIFQNAIYGKQTIKESLEELASVNKGIKRFLPRRKNTPHNKRLNDLAELVDVPVGFASNGVFEADNFVTNTAYFVSMFAVAGFFTDMGMGYDDFHATNLLVKLSLFLSPLGSLAINSDRLMNELPVQHAMYIDEKIKEYYQ